LRQALDDNAWDGAWYRRAYYDDGAPLGSAASEEGQIDSVAQSWAVLSGAGHPERARAALQAVDERLVREQDGLILLLTPPFDNSGHDPGYIQGYVPGIRENGAQYTHAALWHILAHVEEGDCEWALRLFDLINPINQARTPEEVARYKVEPYVIAADVYSHPMHLGRGGWTWYTGSAAWAYRVGLQGILGLTRHGQTLRLRPCIPSNWQGFHIRYRYGSTLYEIEVQRDAGETRGSAQLSLDGVPQPSTQISLVDDGAVHYVSLQGI
jgi:cellobiose phosphorylase